VAHIIGIDTGGTFADGVVIDGDVRIARAKASSTLDDVPSPPGTAWAGSGSGGRLRRGRRARGEGGTEHACRTLEGAGRRR
jgi:hypothetical protein